MQFHRLDRAEHSSSAEQGWKRESHKAYLGKAVSNIRKQNHCEYQRAGKPKFIVSSTNASSMVFPDTCHQLTFNLCNSKLEQFVSCDSAIRNEKYACWIKVAWIASVNLVGFLFVCFVLDFFGILYYDFVKHPSCCFCCRSITVVSIYTMLNSLWKTLS